MRRHHRRPGRIRLLLAVAGLASGPLAAAPELVVRGLFADRAILVIDGEARVLKVGEVSPEGVKLVVSSSRQAKVEIDGQRRVLTLTRQIAATYTAAESSEVRIPRDIDSHYRVTGQINGHRVEMMVDTGATLIAMNIHHAKRLGIDYRAGRPGKSYTAGGVVTNYLVDLDRVSIGGISFRGVPAAVVDGDYPQQILLGNSLLSRLEMQEEGGVLVLRQKF